MHDSLTIFKLVTFKCPCSLSFFFTPLSVAVYIVRLGICDHTLQSYGMTDMISEIDGGVAVNFPRAPVAAGEQVFLSAVTL